MQHRFFDWKDPDSSNDINRKYLGAIPPGVYRGFDSIATSTGTTLRLTHDVTGYKDTELDGTESGYKGLAITKQGVTVIEDTDVTASLALNSDVNPRIDLVVLEHTYVETTGGMSATYTVLQGTPAVSPTTPTLTDSARQIVIGSLTWPGNAVSILDAVWERERSPTFAQSVDYVLTQGNQTVTGIKTFSDLAANNLYFNSRRLLVYSSGVLASSENDSPLYHVAFSSGAWLAVNSVDIVGALPGKIIILRTEQNLMFNLNTSGLLINGAAYGTAPYYLSAGQGAMFQRGGTGWQLISGEGTYSTPTVHTGMSILRAGSPASVGGSGDVVVNTSDNTIVFGAYTTVRSINAVRRGNAVTGFNTINGTPSGPELTLHFTAGGVLKVNQSVPAGQLPIVITGYGAQDIPIDAGGTVKVTDTGVNGYSVISIVDRYNHPVAEGRDVTSLISFQPQWSAGGVLDGQFKAYLRGQRLFLEGVVLGTTSADHTHVFTLSVAAIRPGAPMFFPVILRRASGAPSPAVLIINGNTAPGPGEVAVTGTHSGGSTWTLSFYGTAGIPVPGTL